MSVRGGHGFTNIELSVVLTILALLTPGIYLMGRTYQAGSLSALAPLDDAAGMRAFSEELRADLRSMKLTEGLTLVGSCGKIIYRRSDEGVLLRDGCGETRALARHVAKLAREGSIVEVTFATPVGKGEPIEERFRLALVEGR